MEIGVHVPVFNWPGSPASIASTLAGLATAVEEAGCTSLSVMDHWFQMDTMAPATDPMLEGYTTLGFLAAHTSTIQLGLLVTGVTYRHPGMLAKTVSTLDVLSGGRAQLGIGAAWYEREHEGLGVPFPSVTERFERLEEAIQICLQMWSADDGPYSGTHYQLAETINEPQPISKPRPSILIGGSGERKTLKLVARYADACNLFSEGPDEVGHKLDVLRRHCTDEDRDYDTIEKTILLMAPPPTDQGSAEQFIEQLVPYAELGIAKAIVMPIGPDPVAFAQALGELVIPSITEL